MTLVMSYQHNGSIGIVGDLLLSRDTPLAKPFDIPTRFHEQYPLTNLNLSGLRQKTFWISPHLAVAWAGNMLIARNIVREIADRFTEPYSNDKLLEFIDNLGLTEAEKAAVAFIFLLITSVADGKSQMQVFPYRVRRWANPANEHEVFLFAGSGSDHFADIDFALKYRASDPRLAFHAAVIGRAATALLQEVMSDDVHNYFYGGGFEFLIPETREGKFMKVPLMFAFWTYDENGKCELVGPVFAQEYSDDGVLGLHRFVLSEGRWDERIFEVHNLLTSGSREFLTGLLPEALWAVHYLINKNNPNEVITVQKARGTPNFDIAMDEGALVPKIGASWAEEFASML
ncbi:MAG TPA: hypothetical protein VFB45_06845 [Pseudolabrys sp.]|nr:hypothetical protein [Pseudolabrys sp.]